MFAWEERSPALPTVCASMPPLFHSLPEYLEQEVLGSVFSTRSQVHVNARSTNAQAQELLLVRHAAGGDREDTLLVMAVLAVLGVI